MATGEGPSVDRDAVARALRALAAVTKQPGDLTLLAVLLATRPSDARDVQRKVLLERLQPVLRDNLTGDDRKEALIIWTAEDDPPKLSVRQAEAAKVEKRKGGWRKDRWEPLSLTVADVVIAAAAQPSSRDRPTEGEGTSGTPSITNDVTTSKAGGGGQRDARTRWVVILGLVMVVLIVLVGWMINRSEGGSDGRDSTAGNTSNPSTTTVAEQSTECDFDPDPSSFADPPVTQYQVESTEEVLQTGFVNLHTGPCVDENTIQGTIDPGAPLAIVCQARGSFAYDRTSVWNLLEDGRWITDYFVNGTLVNEFTPGLPQCRRR